MKQYINLYQEQFHKKINWRKLSALLSVALVFFVCLSINLYQVMRIGALNEKIETKRSILKDNEITYQSMQKDFEQKVMDMGLANSVARAKALNKDKQKAINLLDGNDIGNMVGFSALLQGLGRQRDKVNHIWLTEVDIDNGGFDMLLKGKHSRPELLLAFVKELSNEELYAEREFKRVKIMKSDRSSGEVEFVLDTRSENEDIRNEEYLLLKESFMAKLNRFSKNIDD